MNKYMNIHILLISKVINVMDNVLITGHSFVYIISYILIHFSSFHFNWTFICLSYSKDKLQHRVWAEDLHAILFAHAGVSLYSIII